MATHIIASALTPKKAVEFSRYKIVKPAWIVESIKAGKLLSWTDYRVLDEGPSQNVLKFDNSKGLTQATPERKQGYKEQIDNSFYMNQIKTGSTTQARAFRQHVKDPSGTEDKDQYTSNSRVSPNSAVSKSLTYRSLKDMDELQEIKQEPYKSGNGQSDEGTDTSDQKATGGGSLTNMSNSEPPKNMTSEEHNAWLLSDPRLRKSSTANPDFLKQFYSESRLHHLSTWKANLKSAMQRLAAEKSLSGKQTKARSDSKRYIMHVDFDSFFCAVSLKRHPEYETKPAVVAHSTGSGSEIASCNYPARKFGVKNGMWMKKALDLCPDLKVLPYDFPAYEEVSRLFYECVIEVGGVVQSVSVDEALIDATAIIQSAVGPHGIAVDETSVWREQEKADQIAQTLRDRIKSKTGCAVSVGIGSNILQAKVALRKAKPAGQFQLKPEQVLDVIGDLKVGDLPGVAYSIGGRLEEMGISLVKDIRGVSKERLVSILGPKTSEKLIEYSRGIDRMEVGEQPPRKSVSAEISWGIRFINQQEAEEFVLNLCMELERRLVNEQVKGTNLMVKIMRRSLDAPLDPAKHLGHGKCDNFNKSASFRVATLSGEVIGKEAVSILRSYKFSPGDLRGIGVQMTKLEPLKTNPSAPEGSQRRLAFAAAPSRPPAKMTPVTEPIDDIESPSKPDKYGRGVDADPITDDPLTPQKPRVHPALALSKANQDDFKANTPLNVSGTQFIIPSYVDPAVLAELPVDIRSKLTRQRPKTSTVQSGKGTGSESPVSAEPLPSQVDAEVFNALPDDMKAEILATYGRKPAQTTVNHQTPSKVSPRKNQVGGSRNPTTPTKRGGINGKAQRQRDVEAGIMQTNFRAPQPADNGEMVDEIEELDPEFLAELPEDVRKEVVADHRRRRLAHRSGLNAPAQRQLHGDANSVIPSVQTKIHFPTQPPKISFTKSDVTSTREIKDMLDAWHFGTRCEGPHRRDVAVFEKYLIKVIKEERDLEKATALVKWLDILVEQDGTQDRGLRVWRETVKGIKDIVQNAMKQRGMAPLNI